MKPEVLRDSLFTVFIKFVKSTPVCLCGRSISSHSLDLILLHQQSFDIMRLTPAHSLHTCVGRLSLEA